MQLDFSWSILPLHWYVWVSLLATFLVVTMLMTCFTLLSARRRCRSAADPFSRLGHSAWYVFGALLQQGV